MSYLGNVWVALLGRNPFQVELQKVQTDYENTAEKVAHFEELYQKFAAKYKETEAAVAAYQNLTENLRQRVTDKDVMLSQQAQEYEARIEQLKQHYENDIIDRHEAYETQMSERDAKIAGLRENLDATLERLQEANRVLAKDLTAQWLLNKTNNSLEDLWSAMQSGDPEKIQMAVQYLDWSNILVRIAQQHLMVLRRKNELVERLHFSDRKEQEEKEAAK